MKKIIIDENESEINISQISEEIPIFALRENMVIGMVIHEKDGWIIRIGGCFGAAGNHNKRSDCIKSGIKYGYSFAIDVYVK